MDGLISPEWIQNVLEPFGTLALLIIGARVVWLYLTRLLDRLDQKNSDLIQQFSTQNESVLNYVNQNTEALRKLSEQIENCEYRSIAYVGSNKDSNRKRIVA